MSAKRFDSSPVMTDSHVLTNPSGRLELDDLTVDIVSGEVIREDPAGTFFLPPQLTKLLRFFLDHHGQVVSRDQLLAGVWGHEEGGSDDAVNVAVSSLRKALGDSERPFQLIQTLPRRGYRYLGPTVSERFTSPPAALTPENTDASAVAVGQSAGDRTWWGIPVGVLLTLTVAGWLVLRPTPSAQDDPSTSGLETLAPSVAVLPFLDLSESGDQQAFADALVDAILHMLAQSPELRVIARTSSFAFRDTDLSAPAIAQELNANVLLEGNVQRSSERIRVVVQLIDEAGVHIWSRTYDRPAGDLFSIQDAIAREVARTLSSSLESQQQTTDNLAAFEQLALGQKELLRDTVEGALAAKTHFQRALALEPRNVDAMIGLTEAMRLEARLKGFPLDHPTFPEFQRLIETAYETAPDYPRAIAARGSLDFILGDREQAEARFRRAVSLSPNYADAIVSLGRTLWRRGAFDEALDQLRVAHRLDPLSDTTNALLADAYWSVGRAEEALARLREGIRRNPQFPRYFDRMATYLNQVGNTGEAMRYILAQRELDPASGLRWFRVCEFFNQLADTASAERCTDELEAAHDMPDRILYLRQQIAGARGDWEKARTLVLQLRSQFPEMELVPAIVAEYYAGHDCQVTLTTLESAYPEFFRPLPEPKPMYIFGALNAVHCLRESGRHSEASALLAASEETLERIRLMRAPHYVSGLEGIVLQALKGNHDAALTEFETAVDSGWRYYWWGLDQNPSLRPLFDEPRFQAAVARLEQGVAAQRRYFEQNRDTSLL